MSAGQGPHDSFADDKQDWLEDRLKRARQGDPQALGELVQHYRNYLLRTANQDMDARLKTKLSASDLVQESLVSVSDNIGQFRGSSPHEFQVWIRRIIQNEVKNARRKFVQTKRRQVNRETRLNDSALPTPPLTDQQNTPRSDALLREKVLALQSVIATLPEDYQTVLRLRNWQELPFDEIGRQMDRSADAARKLWYRAVLELEKVVQQDFPDLRSGIMDKKK